VLLGLGEVFPHRLDGLAEGGVALKHGR
jgi:hypothetical protein